jgi:hypothetical protein
MSIYKTLPDALKKQNEVKRIEWSAPAGEDESEAKEEGMSSDEPEKKDSE